MSVKTRVVNTQILCYVHTVQSVSLTIFLYFVLQEQLLLSIIPADLAHTMRQSMVERLSEEAGQAHHNMSTRRLWHDFYVREHKQVR